MKKIKFIALAFLALTLGRVWVTVTCRPRPDREGACISMGQQQPEGEECDEHSRFEDPVCYDYQQRQWLQAD